MSEELIRYERNLRNLHYLNANGQGNEEEASRLRKEMNDLDWSISDDEMHSLNELRWALEDEDS